MSVSTRNPLRIIGGQQFSGGPNTGDQYWTQGGSLVATVFSGGLLPAGSGFLAGGTQTIDQIRWSGAGRLNMVIPITAASGVPIIFYDSAFPSSSGGAGVQNSGLRVLAVVPGNTFNAPFGTLVGPYPMPPFGIPYSSGLCVSCVSGTPGFSVSFTPEVVPTNNQ